MMKKDISAYLYQKCLILCSKILLKVLRNKSLTVFFTIATYWARFQTFSVLKAFLATFGVPFNKLTSVFLCVCPVIDHEFRHHIVKVAVDPQGDNQVDPQTTLTML